MQMDSPVGAKQISQNPISRTRAPLLQSDINYGASGSKETVNIPKNNNNCNQNSDKTTIGIQDSQNHEKNIHHTDSQAHDTCQTIQKSFVSPPKVIQGVTDDINDNQKPSNVIQANIANKEKEHIDHKPSTSFIKSTSANPTPNLSTCQKSQIPQQRRYLKRKPTISTGTSIDPDIIPTTFTSSTPTVDSSITSRLSISDRQIISPSHNLQRRKTDLDLNTKNPPTTSITTTTASDRSVISETSNSLEVATDLNHIIPTTECHSKNCDTDERKNKSGESSQSGSIPIRVGSPGDAIETSEDKKALDEVNLPCNLRRNTDHYSPSRSTSNERIKSTSPGGGDIISTTNPNCSKNHKNDDDLGIIHHHCISNSSGFIRPKQTSHGQEQPLNSNGNGNTDVGKTIGGTKSLSPGIETIATPGNPPTILETHREKFIGSPTPTTLITSAGQQEREESCGERRERGFRATTPTTTTRSEFESRRGIKYKEATQIQQNNNNLFQSTQKGDSQSQTCQGTGHNYKTRAEIGGIKITSSGGLETVNLPPGVSCKPGKTKSDFGPGCSSGRGVSTTGSESPRSGLATWTKRPQENVNSNPNSFQTNEIPSSLKLSPSTEKSRSSPVSSNNDDSNSDEELNSLRLKIRERLSKIKVNVDRVLTKPSQVGGIRSSESKIISRRSTSSSSGSNNSNISSGSGGEDPSHKLLAITDLTPSQESIPTNLLPKVEINIPSITRNVPNLKSEPLSPQSVAKGGNRRKLGEGDNTSHQMGSSEPLQIQSNQLCIPKSDLSPQERRFSPPPTPNPRYEEKSCDSDCLVIVECDPVAYQVDDLAVGGGSLSPPATPGRDLFFSNAEDSSQSFVDGHDVNCIKYEPQQGDIKVKVERTVETERREIKREKIEPEEVEGNEVTNTAIEVREIDNLNSKKKFHNLPISELKKHLARCPVCYVLYTTHKSANLCLSKHGKRQCWICLEVMANTKDSYLQHCVQNHAVGTANDIVGCPYCHKFFDFRQGFNQHIVKVHFSEDTSFVNATARLSPTSLVDLYTGQPRQKLGNLRDKKKSHKQSNTSLLPFDTKDNGENRTRPSSSVISKESLAALYKDVPTGSKTATSSRVINFQEEGGSRGEIFKLGNRRGSTRITRDSVIRETPNLTTNANKAGEIGFYQSLNHHRHHSSSTLPVGNPIKFELNRNRPQSQPLPRMSQSISSLESGGMFSIGESPGENPGESSLNLPLRPNSDPIVQIPMNSDPNYENHGQVDSYTFRGTNNGRNQNQGEQASSNSSSTCMDNLSSSTSAIVQGLNAQYFDCERDQLGGQQSYPETPLSIQYNNQDGYPPSGLSYPNAVVTSANAIATVAPLQEQVDSASPSLLEMQKMVKSSQFRMQYLNSVNSMLRTVAECCLATTTAENSTVISEPSSLTLTSLASNQQQYHNMTNVNSSLGSNNSNNSDIMLSSFPHEETIIEHSKGIIQPGPESELSPFKVPSNAGVKRRILTKWDEHQDRRVDSQMHDPSLSHNNISPSYGGSRGEREFFARVIQESKQSCKTPDELQQFHQKVMLFHHTNPNNPNINPQYLQQQRTLMSPSPLHQQRGQGSLFQQIHPNYGNFNNCDQRSSHYPRIMARVDPSGRPTGLFTADGQPCMLSHESLLAMQNQQSNSSSAIASAGSSTAIVDNQLAHPNTQGHRQYQYKITQQASSSNQSYQQQHHHGHHTQRQLHPSHQFPSPRLHQGVTVMPVPEPSHLNSSGRKRKSSAPIRVVQNPQYDCVVVQNPFEEEDATTCVQGASSQIRKKSQVLYPSGTNPTNPIINETNLQQLPASTLGTNNNSRSQAIAQWDALVRQQQQLQQLQLQQQRFPLNSGGKLMNCQPKFTTGGHITDFSHLQLQQTRQNAPRCETETLGLLNSRRSPPNTNFNPPTASVSPNNCRGPNQSRQGSNVGHPQQAGAMYPVVHNLSPTGQPSPSFLPPTSTAWPFLVAPRYQDACNNMLSRLRNLEKQTRSVGRPRSQYRDF